MPTRTRDARPRLLRADDVYYERRLFARTSSVPVAEWAFQKYPPVFVDREAPDLTRRGETSVVFTRAEVNHGRWVARCPFCPSAQVVSPVDARFICAGLDGCANATVRGAFVQIVFPDDRERGLIEAALLQRPERPNRNWRAPETVASLIEENEAHGLDDA